MFVGLTLAYHAEIDMETLYMAYAVRRASTGTVSVTRPDWESSTTGRKGAEQAVNDSACSLFRGVMGIKVIRKRLK
jgi:hypothetical protein